MAWLAPSAEEVRRLKKSGKLKRSINICWYDGHGKIKKKSTGTKDYREARAMLAEFQKQQQEQQKVGFQRTLFQEAAEELIQKRVREKNLRERSQNRYRTLGAGIMEYAGDGVMVHEITLETVDGFRDWARDNVTITTRSGEVKTKPRMADKTLDMRLQFIKAVLAYSYEKGYTQQNIAPRIVPMSKAKLVQKAVRGFTDDELQAIFSADSLGPNIRLCFLGLLHLGVRRGELAQITWNNMDMKGRSIRVYGEKTNKWRTIPISSSLLPHLEKSYAERGKRNHVFSRESGDVADKHLYRTLMRVCKEVGIDTSDITVHSFRHTFIQRHLQAGVNFKTIMQWSGHSDIKTFMVYLDQYQPRPEDIDKADFKFLNIR